MQSKMLKSMRLAAGIKRKDMALFLVTDQANVWRWETGKNEIKLSMFLRWCEVCRYTCILTQDFILHPTVGEEE